MKHVKHVKYILSADQYIKQIPDYSAFGRKTTLRLNPDRMPDLHWNLTDSYHTTIIQLVDSSTMLMSTNCVDVGTFSYAKGDRCKKWCGTTLNTDVMFYRVIGSPLSAMLLTAIRKTMKNN